MSTHNICFRREIRKIICGYPLLSVAMYVFFLFLRCLSKALLMGTHMFSSRNKKKCKF